MLLTQCCLFRQSRPRLFIIGVRGDVEIPGHLLGAGPLAPWHTRSLQTAFEKPTGPNEGGMEMVEAPASSEAEESNSRRSDRRESHEHFVVQWRSHAQVARYDE